MKKNSTKRHEIKTNEITSVQVFPREAAIAPAAWPVSPERQRIDWFPAGQRLIELVRTSADNYVLPPAVVRKAAWRE